MPRILSQIVNQITSQNKIEDTIESQDRSFLIVSLRGDLEEIRDQFTKLKNNPFDILELCPTSYDVLALKKKIKQPWILTYKRGPRQSREEYLEDLQKFILLSPDFIDIDHEDFEYVSEHLLFSGKWIISYHDFSSAPHSPDFLEHLYEGLSHPKATHIKIAISPTSPANALAFFFKARQLQKQDQKLFFVCIGERYSWTRILSSKWNVGATYCSVEGYERYGQVSLRELTETYSYFKNNSKTKVYALLGDPVVQSLSHITHNTVFQEQKLNALYCKIPMVEEEAASFLQIARVRFSGFSVTMPLKRTIVPNQIINTIYEEHLQFTYASTDAPSAIALIQEKNVPLNESILILGTGSTAQAIARSLLLHGWKNLTLLSRTPPLKKIEQIDTLDYESWMNSQDEYGLVINTTPGGAFIPKQVCEKLFKSQSLFFEVNYNPPLTPLVQRALQKECPIIWGIELFALQASMQMGLWFHFNAEEQRNIRNRILSIYRSLFPKIEKLPRQVRETTRAN